MAGSMAGSEAGSAVHVRRAPLRHLRRGAIGALLAGALLLPAAPALAVDDPDEPPSAGAMAADLLVARPIGVVMTVGGFAVWTLSLPFSLPGGNAGEAGEQLVIGPVRDTFVRCLGCRRVEDRSTR